MSSVRQLSFLFSLVSINMAVFRGIEDRYKAIALVVILVLGLEGFFCYRDIASHNRSIDHLTAIFVDHLRYNTRSLLDSSLLNSELRLTGLLLEKPDILPLLATGRREELLALTKPFYQRQRKNNQFLRIMQFHRPDGRSFLRVHDPAHFDDDLSRFRPMIKTVHRDHELIYGCEVGLHGAFCRVVQPLFYQGQYIGALELGVDIQQLAASLNQQTGVTAISYLNSGDWEKIISRPGYIKARTKTLSLLDSPPLLDPESLFGLEKGNNRRLRAGDRVFYASRYPVFKDFRGREIGGFLVLQDLTTSLARNKSFLLETIFLFTLLLVLLVVVLNFYFTRLSANLDHEIGVRRQTEEDLSEREDRLVLSEQQYRMMLEAIADPIAIYSSDYRVEYVNSVMAARCPGEAVGKYCYQVAHGLDHVCSWCDRKVARPADIEPGAQNLKEITSPLDNHVFHVSRSPVLHHDGSLSTLCLFRDITELKEMEKQFHQAQKMEAIGLLAGGVAHDFNNTLTVIRGHAQLALMLANEDNPLWSDLVAIEAAAARATRLTRQLLVFSRRQKISPELLFFNNLVNDLGKMLRRLVGEEVELAINLGANRRPVLADPGQLEQVITNLVINAADATGGRTLSEGRRIIVRSREIQASSKDGAELKTGAWYMLLEVSDNGGGIDPEIMPHIFEPFFTTKKAGEGTGLGLATVYGIVKQNRGTLTIENHPGEGAVFKVFWPLQEGEPAIEKTPEDLQDLPRGKGMVLVVEDEEAARRLARRGLELGGYQVLVAENGLDALAKLKSSEETIDLLFTDLIMPVMGGQQLWDEIKNLYPSMRVIFTSGYLGDRVDPEADFIKEGRFIQKPYELPDLLKLVHRVLTGAV